MPSIVTVAKESLIKVQTLNQKGNVNVIIHQTPSYSSIILLFLGVSSLNTNIIMQIKQPVILFVRINALFIVSVLQSTTRKLLMKRTQLSVTNTTKHNFDESVNKTDRVWTFRLVSTGRSLMVRVLKLYLQQQVQNVLFHIAKTSLQNWTQSKQIETISCNK